MTAPADWQLPPGVSRGVWDYLHDSSVAAEYDESLAGMPLLDADLKFVDRHVPANSRVLDLGCGTGRAAIHLARLGHRVVAVDLSESMLRECGRKAMAAAVSVDRLQANIASPPFVHDQSMDAVVCLFATLGMIATEAARFATLAGAFRALRPGGVLVLHGHNRGHHIRTGDGRRWLARDYLRSAFRSADAGNWPMPHAPGRPGWTMHLFTRRELAGLLARTGFRIATLEPVGLDGRPAAGWFGRFAAYGFLIAARRPAE